MKSHRVTKPRDNARIRLGRRINGLRILTFCHAVDAASISIDRRARERSVIRTRQRAAEVFSNVIGRPALTLENPGRTTAIVAVAFNRRSTSSRISWLLRETGIAAFHHVPWGNEACAVKRCGGTRA